MGIATTIPLCIRNNLVLVITHCSIDHTLSIGIDLLIASVCTDIETNNIGSCIVELISHGIVVVWIMSWLRH